MVIDENDITTTIEKITRSIRFEYVDDGQPTKRNGRFGDDYSDDEGLARKVMNHYYKHIANKPKAENRKFYKAIGRLFSANLGMFNNNDMHFRVHLMSRNQAQCFHDDMPDEEKERIISRKINPNHRNSFITTVGFMAGRIDMKPMEKMREGIFRKQAIANRNYYKVNNWVENKNKNK